MTVSKTIGWLSLDKLAAMFLEIKDRKKSIEIEYNATKANIIAKLDGNLVVESDQYFISYANNQKQVLDVARLKLERPDIYEKFLAPQDCWVLMVKAKATLQKGA